MLLFIQIITSFRNRITKVFAVSIFCVLIVVVVAVISVAVDDDFPYTFIDVTQRHT